MKALATVVGSSQLPHYTCIPRRAWSLANNMAHQCVRSDSGCKSATTDENRAHGHVPTYGRYLGAGNVEVDDEFLDDKMKHLVVQLEGQFAHGARLEKEIRKNVLGGGDAN